MATTTLSMFVALSGARIFAAGWPGDGHKSTGVFSKLLAPRKTKHLLRSKISENAWYFCWHLLNTIFNLILLARTAWFSRLFDFGKVFDVNFHAETLKVQNEPNFHFFIFTNLAFWTSCVFFVFQERRRKDFKEMVVHHFLTVALIAGAFVANCHRVSAVVLLIHDLVDIFLYAAKTANYLKMKRTSEICFVTFAATFFLLRLVFFPVVWTAAWLFTTGAAKMLPAMLMGLNALHWFWFGLILKMLAKFAKKDEKDLKDCRSDAEDTD